MAKLTLTDLTNLQNETSAVTRINNNNTAIEVALENTLSRNGTTPNQMESDLDMNSNRIFNLPQPVDNNEALRLIDLVDIPLTLAGLDVNGLALANSYHFSTLTNFQQATGLNSVTEVHIDGFRYKYVAVEPTHIAKAQNTASSRWYEFAEHVFWQDAIDSPYVANGNEDNAATAAFALGIPLQIESGTASLVVNPITAALADTDIARSNAFEAACQWATTAMITGSGEVRVTIDTAITGAIPVEGQIIVGDISAPHVDPAPLTVAMGAVSARVISAINYAAAKVARVSYISVENAAMAYAVAPTVTFSGGGGAGAAATAYISGGLLVAIDVTNGGTGFTSAPTVLLDGVDEIATGNLICSINLHVVEAEITLTTARPTNCAVGMPVGGQDIIGDGDAEACNGGFVITALPADTSKITVEITSPRATLPADASSFTSGTINFPPRWFEVKGGYTGSGAGQEGYFNATANGSIRFINVHAVWNPRSITYGEKSAQSFIHGGALSGKIHVFNESVVANFPFSAVRLNSTTYYLNFLHAGGGTVGDTAVILQGASVGQLVQSSLGSCKVRGVLTGRQTGCAISSSNFGACATAIDNQGGDVDFQTCRAGCATTGISTTLLGRSYGGTTAVFTKCTNGLDWDTGGMIVANPTFTGSITQDYPFPANSRARGGAWYSSTSGATEARRYFTSTIFNGQGSGNPEGVVTASAGSTWQSSTGQRGSIYYIKQSGGLDTGWTNFNYVGNFAVADLPVGIAGLIGFATNGRKNGEGGGSGTGVLVFHDGTAWRACDTGATAAA